MALGTGHPESLAEPREAWGTIDPAALDGRPDSVTSANMEYRSNGSHDATSMSLTVDLWDVYIGSDQEPINAAPTNSATLMCAMSDHTGWFERVDPSVTTKPTGVDPRVHVSTLTPTRNPVFLVTPSDYAGVYNVTANSLTVSRRYVGEGTFVAVIVNLTDAAYGYQGEKETWLVPRNVFFDTYLSTRLNKAGNMTGWLADPANDVRFAQNASDGPGTSALEATLTTELDLAEYLTLIDWLEANASGNLTQTYIRVDWDPSIGDYFFLLGLPDPIVRLASYEPLPNTPTTTYKWDYRPVWERIWDGTISATLEWIASGFVAAVNFFVNMPSMLAQLGAWLWSAIVGGAQAVASAVKHAGQTFVQMVDWIVDLAVSTITSAISGLLNGVKELFDNTVGRFVRELEEAVASVDPVDLTNRLISLLELVAIIVLAGTMIPVAIRVASIAVKVVTAGVSWLVETAIAEGVAEFIVRVLMGIAFSVATGALFAVILETIGWVEDTTVNFFKTVGLAAAAVYAVSKVVFKLYESLYAKTAKDLPVLQRYKGFALSVFGLALVLYGTTSYARNGTGRLAGDFAGFAFQAFGLLLYLKNRNDPLVQIADFTAPVGSAIEHGVTVLSPPVSATKISVTFATGGYG